MGKKTRTVRISGVDYDFGLTSKDIKVIGLENVGNLKEGDTIHAGTDLDSFIERLLVKEKYPTTITTQGNLVTYFTTKPSISLGDGTSMSIGSDGNGTITTSSEVGTSISISGAKVSKFDIDVDTIESTQRSKVTGFTYGYSDSLDGDVVTDRDGNIKTSIENRWNDISMAGNFGINIDNFMGFANRPGISNIYYDGEEAGIYNNSESNKGEFNLGSINIEGENSIKLTFTPPKLMGSIAAIGEKYIVSNIGNKSNNKKSKSTEGIIYGETGNSSNYPVPDDPTPFSVLVTVTGKYRAGIYLTDSGTGITSDEIGSKLNLLNPTTTGTTTQLTSEITVESGKRLNIVVPPGYELYQVKANDGISSVSLSNFTTTTISRKVGTVTSDYTVYYMQPSVTTTFKLIQIKKK